MSISRGLVDGLHLQVIFLVERDGWEGAFFPQAQQYFHLAVSGAVQGVLLAQGHAPHLSSRGKAAVPFHRRFLLVRPFGMLEFLLHSGDSLFEQTERLLVPPGAGNQVNEERISSGVGLVTSIGYQSGGGLSRDIASTCVAQDRGELIH